MNLGKNSKKLCIKYFDETSQKYILTFSNEFHRSVEIKFMNIHGRFEEKLQQETIYFLVANISNQYFFIYRGYDKNTFFAISSTKIDGRIFCYLPKSKHSYTQKSNYNGMFHICGDTITASVLAGFNNSTLDIIELKKFCR